MTANIQYLTDQSGKLQSVLVPIEEWVSMLQKIETIEVNQSETSETQFKKRFRDAMIEAKKFDAGKIKGISAEDFLRDL